MVARVMFLRSLLPSAKSSQKSMNIQPEALRNGSSGLSFLKAISSPLICPTWWFRGGGFLSLVIYCR